MDGWNQEELIEKNFFMSLSRTRKQLGRNKGEVQEQERGGSDQVVLARKRRGASAIVN
jgi:hypothetical protein